MNRNRLYDAAFAFRALKLWDKLADDQIFAIQMKDQICYISKKDQPEAQAAEVERLNKAYGAETVERVLNRHRRSEFKRKRLPIAIERSLYE